jgi:hypothetical protein
LTRLWPPSKRPFPSIHEKAVGIRPRFAKAHIALAHALRTSRRHERALQACSSRNNLDVLNLGYGTGLCGARLLAVARRLVGVDASPGMLKQCAGKHIYDELIERDVTEALLETRAHWDVGSANSLVATDRALALGPPGPRTPTGRGIPFFRRCPRFRQTPCPDMKQGRDQGTNTRRILRPPLAANIATCDRTSRESLSGRGESGPLPTLFALPG